MKIHKLVLENFRSWQGFELKPAKITILIGPNGAGKTNILEAILMLSTSKSPRARRDRETINWPASFARIQGLVIHGQENYQLELFLDKGGAKIAKIQEAKRKPAQLLGKLLTVSFDPESLLLVSGAPPLRRRFLDVLLCQISRQYAFWLVEYLKILKERNKLLWRISQNEAKEADLNVWNEQLIEASRPIIKLRQEAIDFFNQKLSGFYDEISGKEQKLSINYKKSAEQGKMAEKLKENLYREIKCQATLFGPHRDDFGFELNGKNLALYGSRGEKRTAVLALKFCEVEFLTAKLGERPVLLLDDIFSELDKKRRDSLASFCSHQQTIIATTDLDHISIDLRQKAKIIELK